MSRSVNQSSAANIFWLNRTKETTKNSVQSDDLCAVYVDEESRIERVSAIEHNANELTGVEGPTEISRLGYTSEGMLRQRRARPDFLIWSAAFALGECSSSEITTGYYKHTVTAATASADPPSATLALRIGRDESGVGAYKHVYAGMVINEARFDISPDGYVACDAKLVGGGYREENYARQVISAAENTTQLTLSTYAVAGSDNTSRVNNVVRLRAKASGENTYSYITPTTVSAATPAVIEFSAIGATAASVDYEAFFYKKEVDAYWTQPAAAVETPLKFSGAKLYRDGYWDGASSISAGTDVACDLRGCSIRIQNDITLSYCAGAGNEFADQSQRSGRSITIELTQRARDFMEHAVADGLVEFMLDIHLRGPLLYEGASDYYGLRFIFPRCVYISQEAARDGGMNALSGRVLVLSDETNGPGAIWGYNAQTTYC